MKDVLIIGCGRIAGGYDEGRTDTVVRTHAKAFGGHPGFRLAACVEPDADRRHAFMEHWAIPEGAAELSAFTHRPFAVACIAGPTHSHADVLHRLLDMDVAVTFAEKPLTDDLDEARALVAAFAERGKALVVNYLRRCDPAMAALQADIAAGCLGRLQGAVGLYTKGILNNGSHMVDLLQYLLGSLEPVSVDGALVDYLPEDPTLSCTLAAAGGATIRLLGLDRGHFTIFELDLLFEKQRVRLTDSGFTIARQDVVDAPLFDNYRVLAAPNAKLTQLDMAFAQAADAIFAHLNGGTPPVSTGQTALAAQAVCARLIAMAREQERTP